MRATAAQKKLLKDYRVTEKQVDLLRLVAMHPIFGINAPEFSRVRASALRRGIVVDVWLDRGSNPRRVVKDYHICCVGDERFTCTSNRWTELYDEAIELMSQYEPGWTYTKPSSTF